MKKKLFLLAVFVLALIPFYDVKAICKASISIQYVDLDEQYEGEVYERYFGEEYGKTIPDNSEYITYVIYGDEYTIQNKKIIGLNKVAKYEECYKELAGKYAIVYYLKPKEASNFEETLNSTTNNPCIEQITSATNLKYTAKAITDRPIDGKQIAEEIDCNRQHPICKFVYSDDGSLNIENAFITKPIENYIYSNYKIFVKNSKDNYEKTDKIIGCEDYIVRLYYKKIKQEAKSDTINITQTKNIKMSTYFKDLETPTTTISYRVLDTSIAEIDSEGNIKPLKVGETDIIAEADGIEYTLHLKVTEDMIKSPDITNPATSSTIAIVLGMISSLILVTVYFKMTKERHE